MRLFEVFYCILLRCLRNMLRHNVLTYFLSNNYCAQVICHRVVPLSQAAAHRDALCGSEIVTVNGTRIL